MESVHTTRRGNATEGAGTTPVLSAADVLSATGALSAADARTVDTYRRSPFSLAPPATWLPIVDGLLAAIAERDRTIDALRASNRRLASRRK
jgi:hypothetical protein